MEIDPCFFHVYLSRHSRKFSVGFWSRLTRCDSLGRGNRPMFPFMTFRETSCGAPFIITVGSLLLDPLATSYYHPANLHTWETLVTVLGFILLRIPSLGLGSACHGLLFFLIPVKFGPDETYVPIHWRALIILYKVEFKLLWVGNFQGECIRNLNHDTIRLWKPWALLMFRNSQSENALSFTQEVD